MHGGGGGISAIFANMLLFLPGFVFIVGLAIKTIELWPLTF
jgi:hypothetical protein